MTDSNELEAPSADDYWSLGFVDNPFTLPGHEMNDDEHWVRQLAQAATNRMLVATQRALEVEHATPIWISVGAELPVYYVRLAENNYLIRSSEHQHAGVLALNIPLETMRMGRSRGTLMELAELIAAVQFDETLAAYVARILDDPDKDLPEFAALTEIDVPALAQRFGTLPELAVAEHFGAVEATRKPDDESALVLQEAYLRTIGLEVDPEETPESEESDEFTEWGAEPIDVPVHPSPRDDDQPHDADALDDEAEQDEEPEPDPRRPVADYVIAYMKAHLSPVLARATHAYISDGYSSVAQELKVTKAPKKTVAALVAFAACRFRKILFIYDSFEPWILMDDTTKAKVVGAFVELRWAFGPQGVLALAVPEGLAPQLEEQFAAADRVDWTYSEIPVLSLPGAPYDEAMVQRWLDAGAVGGQSTILAGGPELAPLVAACDNDILGFAVLAQRAFADAAKRGVDSIDEEATAAALEAS